jgi:hypothetical protein
MFRIVVEVSSQLARNERAAEEYITKALERHGPRKVEGTSVYYWRSRIKGFGRVMAGLASQGKRVQEASEFAAELERIGDRLRIIGQKIATPSEDKDL